MRIMLRAVSAGACNKVLVFVNLTDFVIFIPDLITGCCATESRDIQESNTSI